MYRLKERPPILANEYINCLPSAYVGALEDKPDQLVVRAAVFRTSKNVPYLLILKRAESDSLPGLWEFPGGSVDKEDETIRDAVARELKEETGLTTAWLVQEVGHGSKFTTPGKVEARPTKWLAITFVVEVDQIGRIEHATTTGNKADPATENTDTDTDEKATFKDDTSNKENPGTYPYNRFAEVEVRLNDEEHSRYSWVSQQEIQARQVGAVKLSFVSEDVIGVMQQAFELQEEVIALKDAI